LNKQKGNNERDNAMEQNEIKQKCIKLMKTADVAYLSTINKDDFPEIRAMVNLRNEEQYPNLVNIFEEHKEDFLIYMTTDTASTKFKQITENPKASVYFCNPKDIQGLMLVGEVEVVTDKKIKKQLWQDDWKVHYPDGVDGSEYNILRLLPIYVKCWFMPMPEPVEINLL
jgi:general stress protein 26